MWQKYINIRNKNDTKRILSHSNRDYCYLAHEILATQTAWLLPLSTWNPGRRFWSLRKLHFLKKFLAVAVGFLMDLQLNATGRKPGDSNFWVKICLALDSVHDSLILTTCRKSQRKIHQIAQILHFEPQKFCNERNSLSGKHNFKHFEKLEN